ncbi:MAG: hypothetical protein ACQKBT_13105, partial [Puniceicoccales bacterium]
VAGWSAEKGVKNVALLSTTDFANRDLRNLAEKLKTATVDTTNLLEVITPSLPSASDACVLEPLKPKVSVSFRGKKLAEESATYGPDGEPEKVGPYYVDGVPDVQPLAVSFGAQPPKHMGDAPTPPPNRAWQKVGLGGLEKIRGIEMPELVDLARALETNGPFLKRLPKANGYFRPGMPTEIVLDPRIFQNYRYAERVLAHEIG